MKKLITVIMPDVSEGNGEAPEKIEILSYGGKTSLAEAIKRAKGKYTLLSDGDVECGDTDGFFFEAEKAQADILAFDGGFLVKTAVLRDVDAKCVADAAFTRLYAALEAKTVAKCVSPFKCREKALEYDDESIKNLGAALDEFKKCKAKLPREVYSFTMDLICTMLSQFYLSALIAVKKGRLGGETLASLDDKLKENIVLYLAFNKRFDAADLKKLREKNYKLGFMTYKKLLKLYNMR